MKSTDVRLKATDLNNEEELLKKINPDLFRVYRAMMTILKFGGNGSIELHLRNGKIKNQHGLFIKPGFDDDSAPV